MFAVGDDVAAKALVRVDHQCTECGIGEALGIGQFAEGECRHCRDLAALIQTQGGCRLFHPRAQLAEGMGNLGKVRCVQFGDEDVRRKTCEKADLLC